MTPPTTTPSLVEPATGLPLEPTTPIKPSEAIRLGCLIYPVQWEGEFFGPDGNEACALGAMAVGFGWDRGTSKDIYGSDIYAWAFLDRLMPEPLAGYPDRDATDVVYQMNDVQGWSRERIADWLAEQGL